MKKKKEIKWYDFEAVKLFHLFEKKAKQKLLKHFQSGEWKKKLGLK